ncbi:MAG: hypothetical protein IPG39_19015 [Bacteroidetes bacterium]|nr:hypothetical protein [Bacteroidota bacterium]
MFHKLPVPTNLQQIANHKFADVYHHNNLIAGCFITTSSIAAEASCASSKE